MTTFADEHDFKTYPELTNSELATFGFTSPHVQIEDDFYAVVTRVHDGDTVTLECDFRDFSFPLRFSSVDAPELSTGVPGEEARDFVAGLVEGEEVFVKLSPNRVDKYGRLLGDIVVGGLNVCDMLLMFGYAEPYELRLEAELPNLDKLFKVEQWF
jgi:endonuclease YncB( thermonuclease family)